MGKGTGNLRGGGKWLESPHLQDHPKGNPGFRLGGAWGHWDGEGPVDVEGSCLSYRDQAYRQERME